MLTEQQAASDALHIQATFPLPLSLLPHSNEPRANATSAPRLQFGRNGNKSHGGTARQAGTARKRLIELLTCKLCKPNKFHVAANATHNARLQAASRASSYNIKFALYHIFFCPLMTNAAKEPAEQALNAALALFMAIILNWNADSCPKELRPPLFSNSL